jgi:hypothetical protein
MVETYLAQSIALQSGRVRLRNIVKHREAVSYLTCLLGSSTESLLN